MMLIVLKIKKIGFIFSTASYFFLNCNNLAVLFFIFFLAFPFSFLEDISHFKQCSHILEMIIRTANATHANAGGMLVPVPFTVRCICCGRLLHLCGGDFHPATAGGLLHDGSLRSDAADCRVVLVVILDQPRCVSCSSPAG